MRILLAADGSDYSKAAVDQIADRPFPKGSEVRILSVFEWPRKNRAFPSWLGFACDSNACEVFC
jgi:hypothetical protein